LYTKRNAQESLPVRFMYVITKPISRVLY